MVGGMVNDKLQDMFDKDKAPMDWDKLIEPVQQDMRDKYPGLEMLALPATQLVLHQKMEPMEILADMAEMTGVTDMSIETPNTYAIRDRDSGITYYLIKEVESPMAACLRDQCRKEMPLHFEVVNMRTAIKVGRIESPMACPDACCGTCGCCIPVCCCMRTATWTETMPDQPESVIASLAKKPLFNWNDCCNARFDLTFPSDPDLQDMYLYRDDCQCYREPFSYCCLCKCVFSELLFLDEQGIALPPGRHEGCNGGPGVAKGRTWNKYWMDEYKPTPTKDNRYPTLEKKEENMMDFIKGTLKETFTDADTYLV